MSIKSFVSRSLLNTFVFALGVTVGWITVVPETLFVFFAAGAAYLAVSRAVGWLLNKVFVFHNDFDILLGVFAIILIPMFLFGFPGSPLAWAGAMLLHNGWLVVRIFLVALVLGAINVTPPMRRS